MSARHTQGLTMPINSNKLSHISCNAVQHWCIHFTDIFPSEGQSTQPHWLQYGFLIISQLHVLISQILFLEWNSTCFGQFLYPSSGVFHCTHSNDICHTGLLASKLSANLYDIHSYHCCVYSGKLLMMDRRTVRNMQSFIPRINFEKLVHLVGFIIRDLIRCTVTWTLNSVCALTLRVLMSYTYIYGAPILDVSRSHTTTQHSR